MLQELVRVQPLRRVFMQTRITEAMQLFTPLFSWLGRGRIIDQDRVERTSLLLSEIPRVLIGDLVQRDP